MKMIETLFCSLHGLLMDSGWFNKGYEYVELIDRKTSSGASATRPMYYEGGYKEVQNFDVGGMFYIRKNGDTSLAPDTVTRQATPCNPGTAIIMTIPIKVVSAVPREKFDSPRFADEELTNLIIDLIQGGTISSTDLNAKAISIQAGKTVTDSYKLYPSENSGTTFNESELLKFAYVSVDFTITINTDVSCLRNCPAEY